MSRSETWRTLEGSTLAGKYVLRQWVGGSDHSAVFATEKAAGSSARAAIKLIDVRGADADRELARLRENAKLSHPNLISIFDVGRTEVEGSPVVYVAMELADEDLSQILPQRALTPAEVSDMLPPVLDALSYLHGKGLVHGRIRPSNILAAADQLKLSTDAVSPAGQPSSARRRVGVYDAPEVASGNLTPAADAWSLGVTITAALTQSESSAQKASQGQVAGNIPEPFAGIARECLNIDPAKRCSIADIHARLQGPARSVPVKDEPKSKPTPKPEPEMERDRPQRDTNRLPAFVIPLIIVVVVLAAWGLFHSRGKESSAQSPSVPGTDTVKQAPSQPAMPAAAPKPAATTPKASSDGKGSVVHQVLPDVSQSAKNTISGTIKVSVHVNVDSAGNVTSAKLKSAGPSRYFATRALEAAQKWQFSPPQVNGAPTTSAWLVQFRFRRNSVQATPERLSR